MSSCCTKKECLSAFDTQELKLISFKKEEADSIIVSSYEKKSNFTVLIDSQFTKARGRSPGDKELIIFMPVSLTWENDYKFYFPKTSTTYKITDIKTDSQKCNTCFLTTDKFLELSGYEVNGNEQVNNIFEINK